MAARPIPTPEALRKLLRYDEATGQLFWLPRTPETIRNPGRRATDACLAWNRKWEGREAFTATRKGYKVGNINQRTFTAHRVIWAIAYGAWPENMIDHIDGDRANNRLLNLRDVSATDNQRNMRKSARSTSGITGVYWDRGKWQARITINDRLLHLGRFATKDEASAARTEAERANGFSVTHGRRP